MTSSVAFVIRNSTNQNCCNDEHQLIRNGSKECNDSSSSSSSSSSDEYDDYNEQQYPPTTLSIVQLVETSQGKYMLDSSSNYDDTFMSTFLPQHQEVCNGEQQEEERTYIDERVWQQLIEYSVLVDKPLSSQLVEDREDRLKQILLHLQTSTNNNNSNQHHNEHFIQLTNNTKEIMHTLLSIDNLFKWQKLITARSNNQLQWKDIRTFLSQVRNNIPFLTHDGYLKHVVNTHLTFHQFICFSKLIENHLECQVGMNDNEDELLLNIDISDIFPSFDSLTLEEQKVELLACIKDKAVRISAQSCDVIIPTVPSSIDDDLTSNNDEWNIYMKWWSSNTNLRIEFCMRELLFAEKDVNVRRNAQKNGNISLRGRHSKDPILREEYLRRFGCWYYGIGQREVRDDDSLDEDEEKANVNPTTIYTYDFETGQSSSINPTSTDENDSSNPQMPNFHNKSWKPSSAAVVGDQDDHEADETSVLSQLMTIGSTTAAGIVEQPVCSDSTSTSESVNEEEPQHHPREGDRILPTSTAPTSILNETKTKLEDEPFIVCSKINPTQKKRKEKPVSFRRRFLSRVTMDIDNVASMVNNKKDGDKLSGIELFRSKVRLIIMLKRFLGIDMRMIEAVAPQNVDIFSIKVASPPPPRPKTPEEPQSVKPDPRIAKELLAKATSHYKKVLCRKVFNKLASWARHLQIEKEKKEQQRLAEQERIQQLLEKATRLYQRSLMTRLFRALRLHALHQKEERAKAAVPEPVVEDDVEEPPNVEHKYSENHESKDNIGESSNVNCNCMELVVGRSNRKSNLDVLSQQEYNQQFAHGIELSRGTSPRSVTEECGGIDLIDHATMQKMKAGAFNLFDVPEEFVYGVAQLSDDGYNYVEYRTREMSKK